jgi:hypothetical protein
MSVNKLRLVSGEVFLLTHDEIDPELVSSAQFLVVAETGEGDRQKFSLLAMREKDYAIWLAAEADFAPDQTPYPLLVTEQELAGRGLTQYVFNRHLNPEVPDGFAGLDGYLVDLPEQRQQFNRPSGF